MITIRPVEGIEPWVRLESEGMFGRWHMQAGEGPGYVLTACDAMLKDIVVVSVIDKIPRDERCETCQGQHQLRESAA